jgi:hypothetical protein
MNTKEQKDWYQPKTGRRCQCRRGIERDNCGACEGTGWQIDFAQIRARSQDRREDITLQEGIDFLQGAGINVIVFDDKTNEK